jgi:RNA polymerase I-specific transcription initiation factor RRN3
LERNSGEDLFCWFSAIANVGNAVAFQKQPMLLDSILSFQWYAPNSKRVEVWNAYSDALVQVVAGSKNVISTVYQAITGQIRCKKNAVGEAEMDHTKDAIFSMHTCLRRILRVVPSSGEALLRALEHSYPSKFEFHLDRVVYVEACLLITSYCENVSRGVLDLLMRNLIVLDVDIDIEGAAASDELTFSFDEENSNSNKNGGNNDDNEEEDESKVNLKQQQRDKADHLDMLIELVFGYIDKQGLDQVMGFNPVSVAEFPPEYGRQAEFFRTLLQVFQSRILTSPKAQFVQFIMFYACAKNSHVYAPIFLKFIMSIVKDPSLDQQIRSTAATYVGSFVSRFNGLEHGAIVVCLGELTEWCRGYVNALHPNNSNPDLKVHYLFYIITNCIFYILLFRPQCAPLGMMIEMSNLVDCSLNPLLFIIPDVREELCSVDSLDEVLDIPKINDKLDENKGRIIAMNNAGFTFQFPFDPFLLERGEERISPFYRQWEDAAEEEAFIKSTMDSSDSESDSEMDVRAMSLGTPITGSFVDIQIHQELAFSSGVSSSSANNSPSNFIF